MLRYESLVHDLGRSQLVVGHNSAAFIWRHPFDAARADRSLADSVLAGIVTFTRGLLRREAAMLYVEFAHPAPPNEREYRRIFKVPLRFGAQRNAIVFARAMLDWPVPFADATLLPTLERHAEQQLLAQQALHSVAARVRQALEQALERNADCTIAAIAARMSMSMSMGIGLSTRTLQRRLQQEGTSFQEVFDDVRHQLALRQLHDASLSITEIAYRLGYREQSSFNHAFRLWTGVCPSAYRQRLRSQD